MNTLNLETVVKHLVESDKELDAAETKREIEAARSENDRWTNTLHEMCDNDICTYQQAKDEIAKQRELQG